MITPYIPSIPTSPTNAPIYPTPEPCPSKLENAILEALIPQLDDIPRYHSKAQSWEVDFLIAHDNAILPVEVKSEENVKSRSLTMYERAHHPPLRIRFSLRNLSFRDGLLNIPHMLADHTTELIRLALEA